MTFDHIVVFYSIIIIFMLNFLVLFPFIFYFQFRFNNHQKKIKTFFDDLYEINKLDFISKKQFLLASLYNTIFYIIFTILLLIIPFVIQNDNVEQSEKNGGYSQINFILLISFAVSSIIGYLSLLLISFIRISKSKISDERLRTEFQSFIENWKINKVDYFLPRDYEGYRERFIHRQEISFKNINSLKRMIFLNPIKPVTSYEKNDYHKYLLLFSTYLYSYISIAKKWSAGLNEEEIKNLKMIIINNFFNQTLNIIK